MDSIPPFCKLAHRCRRVSIVWFFMGALSRLALRLPIGVLPLINEHLIMMRGKGIIRAKGRRRKARPADIERPTGKRSPGERTRERRERVARQTVSDESTPTYHGNPMNRINNW